MLVEGAHYIISRRGPDTDLKLWGLPWLNMAESVTRKGRLWRLLED
jgi:hypothetical protein